MPSFSTSQDIDICYETFGNKTDPCLVLITGFGSQMIDWEADLVKQFVALSLYVVRFDNRDSGFSSHFNDLTQPKIQEGLNGDWSSAGYSLDDMANDVVELLDRLKVEKAHLFGHSMGTMLAQIVAINHPERVLSLVLLSGTTGNPDVGQPTDDIKAAPFVRKPENSVLENAFESSSRWATWSMGTTEESLRARIKARIDRAYDSYAAGRQLVAIAAAPDRTKALQLLDVPTVVIHGTEDPLVNVSGGKALAQSIPNAKLELIEGLRHDIPHVIWPQLIAAVQRNILLTK